MERKFEDALPLLKQGVMCRRAGEGMPVIYLQVVNGVGKFRRMDLQAGDQDYRIQTADVLAEDWDVVDEEPELVGAPVGEGVMGRIPTLTETAP